MHHKWSSQLQRWTTNGPEPTLRRPASIVSTQCTKGKQGEKVFDFQGISRWNRNVCRSLSHPDFDQTHHPDSAQNQPKRFATYWHDPYQDIKYEFLRNWSAFVSFGSFSTQRFSLPVKGRHRWLDQFGPRLRLHKRQPSPIQRLLERKWWCAEGQSNACGNRKRWFWDVLISLMINPIKEELLEKHFWKIVWALLKIKSLEKPQIIPTWFASTLHWHRTMRGQRCKSKAKKPRGQRAEWTTGPKFDPKS